MGGSYEGVSVEFREDVGESDRGLPPDGTVTKELCAGGPHEVGPLDAAEEPHEPGGALGTPDGCPTGTELDGTGFGAALDGLDPPLFWYTFRPFTDQ